MKIGVIYSLLFCLSISSFGQDWRSMYQEANQDYLNEDYSKAYDLAKQSLTNYLKESGEPDDNYAAILRLLANITFAESNFDEGIAYMEKEIKIREDSKDESFAGALINLSLFFQNTNQFEKAVTNLSQAEEILAQYYKDDDVPLIECRLNLAFNQYYSNQNEKAFGLFQQNLARLEQAGAFTMEYLIGFYYYGILQLDRNEISSALATFNEAKQFYESVDKKTSVEYALVLTGLANAQHRNKNYPESESNYLKGQQVFEALEMTQDNLYLSLLNNRAANLQAMGNDAEAKKLFEQIQQNPAGKSTVGASLNNMAAISMAKGDFENAEKQYQEALTNFDKNNPDEIVSYAETEENLALLKSQTENFNDALHYADDAVALLEKHFEYKHARVAASLNKRGRIKFNKKDVSGASLDFTNALNLLTEINDSSTESVISLNGLGQSDQAASDFSHADLMYTQALLFYEKHSFPKDRLYGIVLNNYASSQLNQGNWADARDTELRVTTLIGRLQGKNNVEYAGALENLAFLNLRLGDLTDAKIQLDSVIAIYENTVGVDSYEYAEAQMSLGRYFQYIGDYPQAEPMIKQGLQTIKSLRGVHSVQYANGQNTLALLFQTMGNYAEAEPLFKEALSTFESDQGKSSREYSTTLQNLASLYQLDEKYQLAEPLLKEVLTIDRALLGELHPQYAISLQNLATLYQKQKKFTEATELLENVKTIIEKTLGQKHPSYAVVISNLAALYQDKGEFAKAETQWKLSLSIRKNILGEDHPDYARSMYGLAGVYHATGKLIEAQPLYEEVVSKYQAQIKNYFSALSESEKGAFYNRIRPVFEAYQDFGVELVRANQSMNVSFNAKLYDLQLSTKAILLNSSNKVRSAILSSEDQTLINFYRQWQESKEDLVKYYNFSKEERQERNIDLTALESQSNELEKRLTQLSTLFGMNYDQKEVTWKDVQKSLKPGEASIEIIRIRKKYQKDSIYYVGLVLLPDAASPEILIWPNGKRLEERLFKYHRNTIKFHFYDSISYKHFWRPIEPFVKDAKTIYFSCDGVFNKVNFNSLQNPLTKKHIIDDYTVRLVSNSRELIKNEVIIGNKSASLFGFVDYNLAAANTSIGTKRAIASRYGFEGEEIPILPATETEVNILTDELKKNNWKTNLFTSHDASETNLKASKNAELIHIATHGFFMSDVDYLDVPDGDNEEMEKFIRNPLFRSGILLAGASAGMEEVGDEDGVLTAYEAMNLSLDQTQLVVLSACETGLGEIRNGEGVYGLQRSFIVAGAQAVMMSLWQVDDAATQELMTEFYKIWLGGEEKFQAFRKAQLAIKEKYEMPYYWAAFVMIGR